MSNNWPEATLGDVLTQVKKITYLEDDTLYKQVTVKLHGKGAVLRKEAFGWEIKTKKQYFAHSGQLIYSRIDARLGAIAIIPKQLEGAIVSNDFPVFNICTKRINPKFLEYCTHTASVLHQCDIASSGTTKRTRIKEPDFLNIKIPLPSLDTQHGIVARLNAIQQRSAQMYTLQNETEHNLFGLLVGAYNRITQGVPQQAMEKVAPLARRKVDIDPNEEYPELGLRSFGKGTFHKPAVKGSELGRKRLYKIEAGDLMFSNVFAWEGAVAVARPEDDGRFGSHRFISRVPQPGVVTAKFLWFHFQTERGSQQLQHASPGSAGRNRTLGLKALDALKVPVPPYKAQLWFDQLYDKAELLRRKQDEVRIEIDALLPSVLNKAFQGEL